MNKEMKKKTNLVDNLEFINDHEWSLFFSFQVIQEEDQE